MAAMSCLSLLRSGSARSKSLNVALPAFFSCLVTLIETGWTRRGVGKRLAQRLSPPALR
jgi:hypothetical protein